MIEKESLFDKRIVDRNIRRGTITPAQLAEQLAGLADTTARSEVVTVGVRDGEFPMELPEAREEE